jgi:hypothetical protein
MTSETWEYISHCHVWGKHSELQEANMSLGLSALAPRWLGRVNTTI